jgi:LCP family protein required for cell wall assembly
MDTSRFNRRTTQKQRQTTKTNLGSSVSVARPYLVRPRPGAQGVVPQLAVTHIPAEAFHRASAPALHHKIYQTISTGLEQPAAPVNPQPRPQQEVIQPMAQPQPLVTAMPVPNAPSETQNQHAPRRALLDMSLPGEESPIRLAGMFNPRWRRARQWAFRTTALALVLMITLGGLFLSQSYLKLHKVFKGTTGTAAALKDNVDPALLKGEGDGRVNVLVLGRGGGTHEAPDLTDTMMIASVDPINHTSTLFSIPRDLWVQVPGGGPMKINAAWETGEFKYLGKVRPGSTDSKAVQAGFDTADQVVESTLGIKIHYNLLVNFQAFQQAVDTLNGVQVNVPADLADPTMAWDNNNDPILARAGLQMFDGHHALNYVRSRETSSDFARSQRQRAVMLALKGKAEQLGTLSNPMKISGLLSAFGNNVSTDLSLSNANRLYSIIKKVGDADTTSAGLGDQGNNLITTQNMNGQSVVVPKAGMFNFTAIQSYTRSQLKDPYILKEHAKVLVLNGTTVPGLASKKSDELKSYGYNVIGAANTPNAAWSSTTLVDLTHRYKYTKNYLENRLGQSASSSLSDTTIPTNGADFVIIIGSDEASNTQTPTN